MRNRRAFCAGFGTLALLGWSPPRFAHAAAGGSAGWPEALGPFTAAELTQARGVYEDGVRGMFTQDIIGRLPPSRRAGIGEVRLEIPDAAPMAPGSPLQVYATTDRAIVLPIRTILWLDQYSGLTAHLQHCAQGFGLCLICAGMTGMRRGPDRPPGPLAAYGLTDDIYTDKRVLEVNQKILASTVCFLLAHELGHIALNHRASADTAHSQQQERDADAYALDIMAYLGVFPLGLAVFFGAAAMMENGQTSHPLSGSRVIAIAETMQARPRAFLDRDQPDADAHVAQVTALARQLRAAAPIIDDRDQRARILQIAAGLTFDQLPRLRASFCPG